LEEYPSKVSMDLQLEKKLVFVTGSTKGIGLACLEKFVKLGSDVIVAGRNPKEVHEIGERMKTLSPRPTEIQVYEAAFDLGNKEGCEHCLKWLETSVKRDVDVLINNLGIFEVKEFTSIPDEDWFRFFEVNVMSGVRLSRDILPKMLAKKSGSIVFISSEASLATKPFMIHYSLTKTAQLSLSRSLAELTKGFPNVRVNTVMPGPTLTEGVDAYIAKGYQKEGQTVEEAKAVYIQSVEPTSLIQRFINPEEIANLVAFVASNQHAINGAALRSEGGILRHV